MINVHQLSVGTIVQNCDRREREREERALEEERFCSLLQLNCSLLWKLLYDNHCSKFMINSQILIPI